MQRERDPRIAFVTAQYERVVSGPGTFAGYLRQAVEENRLDVTFFTSDIDQKQHIYEQQVTATGISPPVGHLLDQWTYHRTFEAVHQREPFDILWYNSSYDSLVSSLLKPKIPLVVMINDYAKAIATDLAHSSQIVGWERAIKNRYLRILENIIVHRADIVIVNSRFMQKEIQVRYRLPAERIQLLYKGVDLELFGGEREKPCFSSAVINILFIKSHYRIGGLADVLKALSSLSFPTALTVIGPSDRETGALKRLAVDIGYNGILNLRGALSRSEVAAEMKRHDIFCVPSRAEALGVVFMEALASGIPVVGTCVGGIPEVLDDGRAGWLVPPDDPHALRKCLTSVITEAEVRNRKVEHGREYVTRFSLDNLISRVKEIAKEVACV